MNHKELVLITSVNHEAAAHCCGCWNLWDTYEGLYFICNECGYEIELSNLLEKGVSAMSESNKAPIPSGHPYNGQRVTEQELAGRAVAPRVSQADVDAAIRNAYYHVIPDSMMTICALTLRNGYTVIGKAACVNAANFQKDIGERLAREDAYGQVWALLGYALADRMHAEANAPDPEEWHGSDEHKAQFIAKVCHEVNRAYCRGIGDLSQPSWMIAPDWQKQNAINGVMYRLCNPGVTPEAMHINWTKAKVADGWKYGRVKDAAKLEHPCMVPYDALPREQRIKDELFSAVVDALR